MKQRYRSGRYYEYLTQHYLKKLGYDSIRSPGSKGIIDISAWYVCSTNPLERPLHRRIQVKSKHPPSKKELLRLLKYKEKIPAISLEVWVWYPRDRKPEIREIKIGKELK